VTDPGTRASPEAGGAPVPHRPPAPERDGRAAVDLHWIPLGAGTPVVRVSGTVYEIIAARRERRRPVPLYHCALEVHAPDGHYSIELAPVPSDDGTARGVVAGGPVGSRWLGRFRVFRYELRCWRDGSIPDLRYAVGGPQRLSGRPEVASAVVRNTRQVPTPVWGRDELHAGEMWNSNSVIAWLLGASGVPLALASPPRGGRAPGWNAGLVAAGARHGTGPTDGVA
jgi:hypothetical protein